jgi:hypothetical protein
MELVSWRIFHIFAIVQSSHTLHLKVSSDVPASQVRTVAMFILSKTADWKVKKKKGGGALSRMILVSFYDT